MLDVLNKYYNDGLLYKQVHPTLPLTIWNYTEKVQYESAWDEITLMCRGLVTDNEGNVVARPFKKFFNIEENKHTPTDKFEVYDKMDKIIKKYKLDENEYNPITNHYFLQLKNLIFIHNKQKKRI